MDAWQLRAETAKLSHTDVRLHSGANKKNNHEKS